MTYRLIAIVLLILPLFFGYAFVTASGVVLTIQQSLGYILPLLATLPLAITWWRQSARGW